MGRSFPPKPSVPPLLSRTLLATSLAVPACGGGNRDAMRIGPPPCEEFNITAGLVRDQNETPLANTVITLSFRDQERVITTDAEGKFTLEQLGIGAGQYGPNDARLTVTAPGYDTVEIYSSPEECWRPEHINVTLVAKPAEEAPTPEEP